MKKLIKISWGMTVMGMFLAVSVFSFLYPSLLTGESSKKISPQILGDNPKNEKWKESYQFVRDNIRFKPTEDVIQTNQGVMWSRKGNAKEQALLLAELLRKEGVETRYAFGRLDDEKAKSLIKSLFPEIRDFSYHEDVPLSFPSKKKSLIQIVKDHCWLQIHKNGQWVNLDPCFPEAEPGQSFAALDSTHEEMDQDFFPRMSIVLEVEKGRFEGKRVLGPEKESIFEWEGTLQEIANQPLSLKILASIRALEEEGGSSPMGGILGGLGGRKSKDKNNKSKDKVVEYTASLHLIKDELEKGHFSQTVSKEEEAEEDITKIVLIFKMENLEGEPMEVERLLFEKLSKDQLPHYFQRHSILITGNEIPREAWEKDLAETLESEKLDELKENLNAVRKELEKKEDLKSLFKKSFSLENEFGPEAGYFINMIFASTSEEISRDLGQSLAVYSYYSLPRIIINTFEGTGDKQRVCMDLRQNSKEAIPYPGQAGQMSETFLYGRGVIDSILEGKVIELLTGKESLTTARLMQIASDKGIPIRIFSHLERDAFENLSLPFHAAQKARHVIHSGDILIIPEQSVEFRGKEKWGWWDLNPQKGEVVGVLESGLHQAVLERTIMDTTGMLHDDMGLVVGAMVGCVDTHWVLFTLILKYGELNKAALQEAKKFMKKIGSYLCPEFEKTAGIGVGASVELEDCWKKEIGIGFSAGLKIDQGWCAQFTKGFKCASTTLLNFYLLHVE